MRKEEIKKIKNKVYASTAYIRKGSKNYLLSEFDRRKIYEHDKEEKQLKNEEILHYSSTNINDDDKEILKLCALFGTWNEKNESEKKIISDMMGVEYKSWIKVLRKLLNQKNKYISLKNNRWKIENKEELIEKYSQDYFSEDINKFKDAALKIIMDIDPKFELEPNKRIMSNIIGEKKIFSKEIQKSVLETFAYIKSKNIKFIHCERDVKDSLCLVVRNVLENCNWKNLATLNELLPILAEINEEEYIYQLNSIIKNRDSELTRLYSEKEEYITKTGYTFGLLWSLELIAWNPKYIMQIFDLFGKLGKYDEKVIDSMSRILLPWYPQTNADFTLRKATLVMLLKEYNNIGWKVLMKLMPNQQLNTFPTYKPKWNNIIENEKKMKITKKELYVQYNEYVKLAIEYSKTDKDRIISLIDELDDVPKDLFELICKKITSEEVKNIDEEERFYIWNELENLIVKHKVYSDTNWSLPDEAIQKLERISKKIKPQKKEIYYKRLFNNEYWILTDKKDTYDVQEMKLLEIQKNAVNDLLKSGIKNVINFASTTKDPYRVGIALSEIELNNEDENIIIRTLDTDDFSIAQGYIYKKFLKEKFSWLEKINISNISILGRTRLLIKLPNNKLVWKKVEEWLGNMEVEYWKQVDIRYVDKDSQYNYALRKLLKYDRPIKALDLINMALHEKRKFSEKIAAKALNDAVYDQENINYIDVYSIKNIISFLQENKYDSSELFKIEWSYLPILDNNDKYRPITIEKKLSEDPKIFIDVICLAFKAEKDKTNKENNNEKLAINAYRLLNIWKIVPGTNDEGFIDKDKFICWFEEMKNLALEKDRLEVSLLHFGQVLFYSPKSKDGFWIDRNVAQLLNRDDADVIRRGYSLQAFNSVGVVNVDSEGTEWLNLEKEWNKKAESTGPEYFRFVKTIRDIAQNFHEQAKYMQDHYEF